MPGWYSTFKPTIFFLPRFIHLPVCKPVQTACGRFKDVTNWTQSPMAKNIFNVCFKIIIDGYATICFYFTIFYERNVGLTQQLGKQNHN
jgi:hypothetical protein